MGTHDDRTTANLKIDVISLPGPRFKNRRRHRDRRGTSWIQEHHVRCILLMMTDLRSGQLARQNSGRVTTKVGVARCAL